MMLNYLIEIRKRTIYVLIFFSIFFAIFFGISSDLFHILILPLLKELPPKYGLVVTQISTPLFTPIKLAMDCALLVTFPFLLFHVWRFISPALYKNEAYSVKILIFSSLVLCFLGVLFCYFFVLPFTFKFMVKLVPDSVILLPDMGFTVDFITRMLTVFGLCFQLPLVILLLVQFGLLSMVSLKAIRPYFIVFAFILGMLLTPPDVFSQIMLAIPLLAIYELSICIAKYLCKIETLRRL